MDESEIDAELGLKPRQVWTEPENPSQRFLEDIQEESEEASESNSVRSAASSMNKNGLFRNEALASKPTRLFHVSMENQPFTEAMGQLDPLTLDGLQMLGLIHSSDSANSGHPLRVLSREAGMENVESFSCTSDQLECLSLPGTYGYSHL